MGTLLNRRRVMGGVKGDTPLPPNAVRVEYLESNGTQWINTTVLADLDTVVELRGAQTVVFDDNTFIGSDMGTSGRGSFIVEYYSKMGIVFSIDGVAAICRNDKTDTANTWHDIKACKDYMIVDNVSYIKSRTPASFSTPYPLIMFAFGRNGTPLIYGKNRISYLKLFSSSTLVRDYIPVRIGQDGYMYDRVSGELFGNSGTGSFILGPDIN